MSSKSIKFSPIWVTLLLASSLCWGNSPAERDLTPDYLQNWDGREVVTQQDLKDYHVLIVGGFLSQSPISSGSLLRLVGVEMGHHFEDYKSYFSSLQVSYEHLDLDTQSSVEYNAMTVEDAIRRSPKPVILMSHSKGCLDTMEALITRPDLQEKVAGWLAIQGPFWGSPVADYVMSHKYLRYSAMRGLEALGGSLDSMKDLTRRVRTDYMNRHAEQIQRMVENVPVLLFTSWKPDTHGLDSTLENTRDWMSRKLGLRNDGLVPVYSQRIPNVPFILLEGLDHGAPVVHTQFNPFNRFRMLRSVFPVLLNEMKNE